MKLNYYSLWAILLVGVVFISGCVSQSSIKSPNTNQASEAAKTTPQQTQISTVISPARDLTGEWEGLPGSAKWHDNVLNWACSYEGYLHLSLKQNGNALIGTFRATITKVIPNTWNTGKVPCSKPGAQPSAQLTGTVSSSEYKFTVANLIDFTGIYTSNTIDGSFESCPNQRCLDGTSATGTIGDFKAARQR